jgi:tetratricopeptide (TPR) repeat protein
LGFDPPSLQAAAAWCLQNNTNYDEALNWINSAADPNLGGLKTFRVLSTKAGLLAKLNRKAEADSIMAVAVENGNAIEMHSYGRQLMTEKKPNEAMVVFEKNFKKYKGAWPTHVGMMRGLSATGNLKKALEHAKLALAQAPDEENRKRLQQAIQQLSEGRHFKDLLKKLYSK